MDGSAVYCNILFRVNMDNNIMKIAKFSCSFNVFILVCVVWYQLGV